MLVFHKLNLIFEKKKKLIPTIFGRIIMFVSVGIEMVLTSMSETYADTFLIKDQLSATET